jgi:hypothetical protein
MSTAAGGDQRRAGRPVSGIGSRDKTEVMLAAISQEAFAHVPEKPRLIEECIRIVKPGGMIASTGRKPG